MAGVQTSIVALLVGAVVFSGGWFAIHTARAGFDYMSSRGNPRNRAQAHESLRDNIIGFALVVGATSIGAFIATSIKI